MKNVAMGANIVHEMNLFDHLPKYPCVGGNACKTSTIGRIESRIYKYPVLIKNISAIAKNIKNVPNVNIMANTIFKKSALLALSLLKVAAATFLAVNMSARLRL